MILLIDFFFSRLGRPGVSVQVRHDPVPDPSLAGSGTSSSGSGGIGPSAGSSNVGSGVGSGLPGDRGGDRGSNAGQSSGSAGLNHHTGAGTGPGGASITGSSGSSSSLLGASGATGGHNPVGSSAPGAGPSGNAPSNHVRWNRQISFRWLNFTRDWDGFLIEKSGLPERVFVCVLWWMKLILPITFYFDWIFFFLFLFFFWLLLSLFSSGFNGTRSLWLDIFCRLVEKASGGGVGHHSSGGFSTTGPAVLQLQFLINEGALVSATADDSLHLWNIRQKRPDIVHSLKFQRER